MEYSGIKITLICRNICFSLFVVALNVNVIMCLFYLVTSGMTSEAHENNKIKKTEIITFFRYTINESVRFHTDFALK